jgi:hypothetical protein
MQSYFLKLMSVLVLLVVNSYAGDQRCSDPASRTKPIREDLSKRINFECEEYEEPKDKVSCDDFSGTYSIFATFDASHCGIRVDLLKSFTVYVTQEECSITVSYESGLNPDVGSVEGSVATFSGTSLIGNITDIHTITATKTGKSILLQ